MAKILLLSIVLTTGLISCLKNGTGKVCTEIFISVTVTVKDQANNPVKLDSSYTKVLSNDKILRPFTGNMDMYPGTYVLISDGQLNQIPENKNTNVKFIGFKGGQKVVDEPFTVTQDGCHVDLVSGKTNITANQ